MNLSHANRQVNDERKNQSEPIRNRCYVAKQQRQNFVNSSSSYNTPNSGRFRNAFYNVCTEEIETLRT